MKKKVLFLLASLALVTTLAVNGTLATTIDEAVDALVEFITYALEGPKVNTAQLDVTLVTTNREGNSTEKPVLYPAHYSVDTEDLILTTSSVTVRDQSFNLWSNNAISGIAEQFVSVKNEAAENVYFLVAIAVKDNAVLRSNISPAYGCFETKANGNTIRIKNEDFKMWVYLYKDRLTKPDISKEICVQMALEKEANNAHMADLGHDFLQIKVIAIEADAFTKKVNNKDVPMTYAEAFDAAIDWENFNPFN